MTRAGLASLMVLAALLAADAARAQSAGVVAELDGQAEVGRGTTSIPAAIGLPIEVGDTLRTGRPGRLRVVFVDDSVVVLGDDSLLVIDEHVFVPDHGGLRSLFRLISGRMRALVSEYYLQPGASYEIQTVTAVAGVRGTEFVVSADAGRTEVIGVHGRVEVLSLVDRRHQRVLITAREVTLVARGALPTPPRRLGDDAFRRYLEGLEFIGAGAAMQHIRSEPFVTGAAVREPDRAAAVAAASPVTEASLLEARRQDFLTASTLIGQPPSVVQSLSGRVRVEF